MNTITDLKTAAAKHDTDVLMGGLYLLEAVTAPTEAERLTKAAVSDVITERHSLDDLLDAVYMDDDYTGTYTDALAIALAAQNA